MNKASLKLLSLTHLTTGLCQTAVTDTPSRKTGLTSSRSGGTGFTASATHTSRRRQRRFWAPSTALGSNHSLKHTIYTFSFTGQICAIFIFFKLANPGLFFVYFWSFQTNNTIFTTNQCEKCPNVHLVNGARIRTHNLQNMSHHP